MRLRDRQAAAGALAVGCAGDAFRPGDVQGTVRRRCFAGPPLGDRLVRRGCQAPGPAATTPARYEAGRAVDLCDQHRAQATGYRGDPKVSTPNLDNLGRQGVRFDCAVAGAPWCTPFRGALLSGRYPHQTGVVANGIRLPPELPTVATAFGDAGYHTAYVGKWHLDGTNDPDHYVPPERRGGFRYWVGNEASNNQHEHYVYGTGRERPWRLRGAPP